MLAVVGMNELFNLHLQIGSLNWVYQSWSQDESTNLNFLIMPFVWTTRFCTIIRQSPLTYTESHPPSPTTNSEQKQVIGFMHLTQKEKQQWYRHGLCLYCENSAYFLQDCLACYRITNAGDTGKCVLKYGEYMLYCGVILETIEISSASALLKNQPTPKSPTLLTPTLSERSGTVT